MLKQLKSYVPSVVGVYGKGTLKEKLRELNIGADFKEGRKKVGKSFC